MRGVVSSNSFLYLSFRDVRVTRASSREGASLEEVSTIYRSKLGYIGDLHAVALQCIIYA